MNQQATPESYKFVYRLTSEDWDKDLHGWRFPLGKIPTLKIVTVKLGVQRVGFDIDEESSDVPILHLLPRIRPSSSSNGAPDGSYSANIELRLSELSTRAETEAAIMSQSLIWKKLTALISAVLIFASPFTSEGMKLLARRVFSRESTEDSVVGRGNGLITDSSVPSSISQKTGEVTDKPTAPNEEMEGEVKGRQEIEFTESLAVNLVKKWLEIKANIYRNPTKFELAQQVLHSDAEIYLTIQKELEQLQEERSYVEYKGLGLIGSPHGSATVSKPFKLVVTESVNSRYVSPNGAERFLLSPKRTQRTYFFEKQNGEWKIYDYQP